MPHLRSAALAFAGLILATSAHAAPAAPGAAADPMVTLYACADKTADAERLACYDAEVKRLRAAQLAGDFTAIDRLKAETLRREAFGFTLPSLPKFLLPGPGKSEGDIGSISAKVVSMTRGEGAVLKLDNGQTWTIIDTDRPPYQLRPGSEIEISRAALGSFLMQVKGSGKGMRVKRTD